VRHQLTPFITQSEMSVTEHFIKAYKKKNEEAKDEDESLGLMPTGYYLDKTATTRDNKFKGTNIFYSPPDLTINDKAGKNFRTGE
jgi:hypothetical protein